MSIEFAIASTRTQAPLPEAPFHAWRLPPGKTVWCEFRRVPEGIHLRFPDLADFVVARQGREVLAYPVPGLDAGTLEHLHLNQVLPLALSAQGLPVFHASAVEMEAGAIAFLGESGRGKSTLATYLAQHGAPLFTDDGLELEWEGGRYLAKPSHPSVRLWDDSLEALVGDSLPTAPPVSYTSKSRFLAAGALPLASAPRPLARAYFLGTGDSAGITITPLPAAETVMEWVRHSFLLDIGDRERLSTHFDQITALARLGICYRLDYPRDYRMLPAVRDALAAHAA